jgi:glucose/mannose transport system substrate-binding protein
MCSSRQAPASPARQKPNPHNTAEDWCNATWDVVDRFWTDPNMTEDDAIACFQEAYDSIF